MIQNSEDTSSNTTLLLINTVLNIKMINTFPNKSWFSRVCSASLLKTLREKDKLLVTIYPFPTVFSACLEKFLPFLSSLKLSSANSFNLEESKICRLGNG